MKWKIADIEVTFFQRTIEMISIFKTKCLEVAKLEIDCTATNRSKCTTLFFNQYYLKKGFYRKTK